jgi:hypothetical protein
MTVGALAAMVVGSSPRRTARTRVSSSGACQGSSTRPAETTSRPPCSSSRSRPPGAAFLGVGWGLVAVGGGDGVLDGAEVVAVGLGPVGDGDEAARGGDAGELGQGGGEVVGELQGVEGRHQVEVPVRPGEALGDTQADLGAGHAGAGALDHAGGRVDAGRVGAEPVEVGEEVAGAATDVEHARARADPAGLGHGAPGGLGEPAPQLGPARGNGGPAVGVSSVHGSRIVAAGRARHRGRAPRLADTQRPTGAAAVVREQRS